MVQRSNSTSGLWAAGALALAIAIAWLLASMPEPGLPSATPQAPGEAAAALPGVAPSPEPPAASPPVVGASRSLLPVDWVSGRVTGPERRWPEGKPAYRGQLVLGADLQPLAGTALRLTPVWLDTVLPEVEERTGTARRGEPPLLTWRGRSGEYGYFDVPFAREDRDLFLVIDPDGPHHEILMLPRHTWRDETIDLGTIVLEERGGVRGRIVDPGPASDLRRLASGARVRAVDLPLSNVWVGTHQREKALSSSTTVHQSRMWSTGRGLAEIPRWIHRRDQVLPFPETTTDGAGRFALPSVRPGIVRLVVQTRDGIDAVRDVTVEPGRTTDIELILPDLETARLAIRDHDQQPTEVEVVVAPSDGASMPRAVMRPRRTVEGELRASSRSLADGQVFVRRSSRWPWEGYRARRVEQDGFAVTLRPLGAISLEVHAVDGGAAEQVDLTLLAHDQPMGIPGAALAESLQPVRIAPGLWRAEELPQGRYRAIVRAPGYAPALAHVAVAAEPHPPVPIHLFPTFELTMRVVDASRRPVAGATVLARPHDGDRRHAGKGGTLWGRLTVQGVNLGTTDGAGELRVLGFWHTGFSLEARHRALGRGLVRLDSPEPDQRIEIQLREPGTLLGTITDRGAPPIETLLVVPSPSRELLDDIDYNVLHEPVAVRVDEVGRFTLRDLWPGLWMLEVRRPHEPRGEPRHREAVWVGSGATDVVHLEIRDDHERLGDVTGRVRVNGRAPGDLVAVLHRDDSVLYDEIEERINAVFARLRRMEDPPAFDPSSYRAFLASMVNGPFHAVERVDADGRFAFHDVPPTQLWLSIRRNRDGKAEDVAIRRVPADRERHFELDLELETGTLRLQVLTPRGPCRNRELRAASVTDPGLRLVVVTDRDGQIELSEVVAGEYELQLGEGADARSARCQVVAGVDRWQQLVLQGSN